MAEYNIDIKNESKMLELIEQQSWSSDEEGEFMRENAEKMVAKIQRYIDANDLKGLEAGLCWETEKL